ncbi:heme-binding protein [Ulvibacter sp. MAR_2010_11]|uniref:heme-binding domain-containing protein n=1 Tax=Ulvibacter sp. MAR_2010_11 TaxID=1250229 RepID=UPI000C2B6BAD|nr:heme-binding domain-containing protein [Ulvibacter sp. MAR_2010_11]PKA82072.1 heme-binding protein [Ulvibacter sp. MAR_2010_11]
MKKVIKLILILALLAFIAIQFIRPERNNDGYESVMAFENETKPSVQVAAILKENCYDCHSNHTQYPWYAEIAPFSFYLEDHIRHGRGEFNVSAWADYSVKKKDHKLEEVIEKVQEGVMPLDSYTWIHGDLDEDEKILLIQWATVARLQYKGQLNIMSK